ncbi:rRNA maturation RNase YbeY [Psychroserpens mesophilus]|uniref:rRNA maturation RNase YbeY n=1 Tax=Psychroserpens mesophilus TaxID=325473 RepID=UPI00058F21B5|nr:rRNA maturation RNase YbeY [Psychroserpens mesophilus]
MISFNYETNFELPYEQEFSSWISKVISSENCKEGEINYIFCDDDYLLDINQKYLNHDTLTDIISFDYSVGKELHGDIYISVDRVKENAKDFEVDFKDEIRRVMVHGVLHYCGYKDKSKEDKELMRSKEDHYIKQGS